LFYIKKTNTLTVCRKIPGIPLHDENRFCNLMQQKNIFAGSANGIPDDTSAPYPCK